MVRKRPQIGFEKYVTFFIYFWDFPFWQSATTLNLWYRRFISHPSQKCAKDGHPIIYGWLK
jgi:hypothetical protein